MRDSSMWRITLFALLFQMTLCTYATAHRVIAFASYDGKVITVEGYMSRGQRVRNGEVVVKDKSGHIIVTGKTDENGIFTFVPNDKPPFSIVLKAGPGHVAKTILNIPNSPHKSHQTGVRKTTSKTSRKLPINRENNLNYHEKKTECSYEDLVSQLEAIRIELKELRRNQGMVHFHDIIGGIGYLVGIFGIIAILKNRGKTN